MRGIRRSLLATAIALALSAATMTTASAGNVLDDYCSPSGDYCTLVMEKGSGTIVFKIRAFADYFGRSQACVTKDTRVCHERSPHREHGLFEWKIAWQDNYPDQGRGEYELRWIAESGDRIGPVLRFEA